MNIDDLKKKVEEIRNRKEVEKVTRIESSRTGYKIYFKIYLEYAQKHQLIYNYRIYEYNATSNIKELEYADTNCIEAF